MSMKKTYIAAAVIAAIVIVRAKNNEAQATQLHKSIPRNGSDFVTDMWCQLNGGGLTAAGYPNLAAGANADPGNVGRMQAGAVGGWDGSMRAGA